MIVFNILSELVNTPNATDILASKKKLRMFYEDNGYKIKERDIDLIKDTGDFLIKNIEHDNGEWNWIRNKAMTDLSHIKD